MREEFHRCRTSNNGKSFKCIFNCKENDFTEHSRCYCSENCDAYSLDSAIRIKDIFDLDKLTRWNTGPSSLIQKCTKHQLIGTDFVECSAFKNSNREGEHECITFRGNRKNRISTASPVKDEIFKHYITENLKMNSQNRINCELLVGEPQFLETVTYPTELPVAMPQITKTVSDPADPPVEEPQFLEPVAMPQIT